MLLWPDCGFSCFWGMRLIMVMSSVCSQETALLPTTPKLLDMWSTCVQSAILTSSPRAVSAQLSAWLTFHV